MGILDEAIREHLELKRRRGAPDSELQKLEDEAFGPPSRPGEPDFPGDEAEQSGNGVAREGAVAEAPAAPEAPIAPPPEDDPGEAKPDVEAPEEPSPVEDPQAEPAAEPPAEPEEETAIYDQTGEDLELDDLDLDLAEGEPASEEAPIETLDTVEHALPDEEAASEAEEPGTEAPEDDEPSEPAEEGEPSAENEPEAEEDVLADTPEFLKDAPEDDELWFEQGKPKDFDF